MIFDLIPEKTAVVILQTHLLLQTLDHPAGVFAVVILPRVHVLLKLTLNGRGIFRRVDGHRLGPAYALPLDLNTVTTFLL